MPNKEKPKKDASKRSWDGLDKCKCGNATFKTAKKEGGVRVLVFCRKCGKSRVVGLIQKA